jgi:hypothetical protein
MNILGFPIMVGDVITDIETQFGNWRGGSL